MIWMEVWMPEPWILRRNRENARHDRHLALLLSTSGFPPDSDQIADIARDRRSATKRLRRFNSARADVPKRQVRAEGVVDISTMKNTSAAPDGAQQSLAFRPTHRVPTRGLLA